MTTEWLIIIPVAATVALVGSTGVVLQRRFHKRKLERLAQLKGEHARLEIAVSELLSRVNEIDIESKYYQNSTSLVSSRLGDICADVGQLADSVAAAGTLLERSNDRQASQLILSSLAVALHVSDEINRLRSDLRR